MSFLWKYPINYKSVPGEAIPFDPTDFLQFTGISGAAKSLSSVFEKGAVTQLKNLYGSGAASVERTSYQPQWYERIFGAAKTVKPTSSTIPRFEIGSKLAVTGTTIGAAGLASSFFFTTSGGQESAKNLSGGFADFGEFAKNNGQILTIFLVLIGLGIVVSVIKK